jgi:large-conductance mechanosensitive channel
MGRFIATLIAILILALAYFIIDKVANSIAKSKVDKANARIKELELELELEREKNKSKTEKFKN